MKADTIKIKMLATTPVDGKMRKAGTTVTVSAREGRIACAYGKAEPASSGAREAAKGAAEAKGANAQRAEGDSED